MNKLFSSAIRTNTLCSTPFRSNFTKPSLPSITRTIMASHATKNQTSTNADLKIDKLFSVNGFTAIVTGGGTGIGLMITQALVSNGAKVYITGRRQEALDTVAKKYQEGGQIVPMACDITSKDDIKKLIDNISKQEPGGIHLLVNNAGVALEDATKYSNSKPDMSDPNSISEHMLKSEWTAWQDTLNTNVTAHFFFTAYALPLLGKGRTSIKGYTPSVVNITSISGLMKGSSGGQFAYGSSKAAMIHLTRMMASTFSEAKIRVNTIAPGIFPSEMTAGSSNEMQKSELAEKGSNPAGRPGHDTDMAACILFLAGPGGVFLNGQILHPDGGHMIVEPAVM